jgi:hypothetical protein
MQGQYAAGWLTQFQVLLHRAFVAQLRNPTDVTSRLLLSVWVGILAGVYTIFTGSLLSNPCNMPSDTSFSLPCSG